ncbi:hypothetical protein ACG1VR_12320 [Cedecea davisae]|uniref:hypothetical protein n=1 Tax=Cedecea davisae TaxID=158484 RepID=UPI00376EBFD7
MEETAISLNVMLQSKHPLAGIEWHALEFFESGGAITGTAQGYQALLPEWKENSTNQYIIKAIAHDIKGNVSQPVSLTLTVTPELVRVSLAGNISGEEGQTLPLGLNARTASQVARVEWDAREFKAAGGKIQQQKSRSPGAVSLNYYAVLPAFRPGERNTFPLNVTVWDSEGHYSEKQSITITVAPVSVRTELPAIISASEGSRVVIPLKITANYGLEHLDWQATEFYSAGGSIEEHAGEYIAVMPAWQPSGNDYPLTVTAIDKRGISSQPTTTMLQVSSSAISLAFDGNIEAEEQQQLVLTPRIISSTDVDRIDWQADSFFTAGGKIEVGEQGNYLLSLPAWQAGQPNKYEISARAVDVQGRLSAIARFSVNIIARTLTVTLPADMAAGEGEQLPFEMVTSSNMEVDSVDIHADEFIAAGGKISGTGLLRQLTLPPVQHTAADTYLLNVVVRDKNGRASPPASVHLTVQPRPMALSFSGNTGGPESTLLLLATHAKGPFAVQRIEWEAAAFLSAGGQITPTDEGFSLKLPPFSITGSNAYDPVATAIDIYGRHSEGVPLHITVTSALLNKVGQCDVVGGGAGYTGLIDKAAVDYREATDFPTLQALVARGEKYIYIPGNVTIDVPNQGSALNIRSGTTIFSDRGLNGSQGGRLRVAYNGETDNKYAVIIADSDTRMSGLRYEGPYKGTTTRNTTIGIQSRPGSKNIEIDNTELWGWPWAAVSAKQSKSVRVHHSFIHDNIRTERGYGVVTQNGDTSAEVACNIFDANRHAIAGEGKAGESYNAHHNLVLNGGGRGAYHQFDMHASAGGIAGEFIGIRENWFDYGRYGTSNRSSVLVRGQATSGPIIVENNWFSQPWLNGTNKQVSGLYGQWVASEEDILSHNSFSTALLYHQFAPEHCVMNWLNFSQNINCSIPGLK